VSDHPFSSTADGFEKSDALIRNAGFVACKEPFRLAAIFVEGPRDRDVYQTYLRDKIGCESKVFNDDGMVKRTLEASRDNEALNELQQNSVLKDEKGNKAWVERKVSNEFLKQLGWTVRGIVDKDFFDANTEESKYPGIAVTDSNDLETTILVYFPEALQDFFKYGTFPKEKMSDVLRKSVHLGIFRQLSIMMEEASPLTTGLNDFTRNEEANKKCCAALHALFARLRYGEAEDVQKNYAALMKNGDVSAEALLVDFAKAILPAVLSEKKQTFETRSFIEVFSEGSELKKRLRRTFKSALVRYFSGTSQFGDWVSPDGSWADKTEKIEKCLETPDPDVYALCKGHDVDVFLTIVFAGTRLNFTNGLADFAIAKYQDSSPFYKARVLQKTILSLK
jgi:hypothetical protein